MEASNKRVLRSLSRLGGHKNELKRNKERFSSLKVANNEKELKAAASQGKEVEDKMSSIENSKDVSRLLGLVEHHKKTLMKFTAPPGIERGAEAGRSRRRPPNEILDLDPGSEKKELRDLHG